MTDESKTISSVTDLFSTTWFWVIPLAGGVVDYIVQSQRGLKPKAPPLLVFGALTLHSIVALVSGCILALLCGAAGYNGEMAFGAAGGIGGYLGVRIFDIGMLLIKIKAGAHEAKTP